MGDASAGSRTESLWRRPPEELRLLDGEVHIWCASLNPPAKEILRLQETLAEDEQRRAERFHFEKDRRRFIVARGILRAILSGYVQEEPDRLRFSYSPHGKPTLLEQPDGQKLEFNLSHSSDLALYAVTRGRRVGIDLERVRPVPDVEGIASRFFSVREYAALCALPEGLKLEAFFTCWTRKEAYIKARGEGLSLPLKQFDVSFTPGEPASLLYSSEGVAEARRWSLHALPTEKGYIAALALEGADDTFRFWEWWEEG